MSPLGIEMLIWFCTRAVPDAGPMPNIQYPAQRDMMMWMIDQGVIRTTGHADMPEATDKGRAWLELICATPMPVQQWIDPRIPA